MFQAKTKDIRMYVSREERGGGHQRLGVELKQKTLRKKNPKNHTFEKTTAGKSFFFGGIFKELRGNSRKSVLCLDQIENDSVKAGGTKGKIGVENYREGDLKRTWRWPAQEGLRGVKKKN